MGFWEAIGETGEWYTPKYIFDALECVFDIDVASPTSKTYCNVPAKDFITSGSLILEWPIGSFVWMNPPFGGRNGKSVWLDKIKKHGSGIALVPDRTSAPWWQKAAKECDALLFISGKVKFIKPDGTTGDSPSTGTTLLAYGQRGVNALFKADKNGLGIYFSKNMTN